jgi:hypothetical protein
MGLKTQFSTESAIASSTTSRHSPVRQAGRCLSATRVILLGWSLAIIFCSSAAGQSPAPTTETQVWPEIDAHVQLPSHFRVLTFSGLEQGVGFPYQQWYAAAGQEHYFLFGGGYEFLRTLQSGKISDENRLDLDGVFNFRPTARFLVSDRNRVEFRWKNGNYSTTYRNKLTVERDFLLRGFRFTPYVAAEAFYDGAQNSWNQEWYYAGIQWPYKRLFMVDTYYQRQNCTTCNPTNWNVVGVTLNFYFRNTE